MHEAAPQAELLKAEGLRKAYGGIVAVNGVSLTVNRGETLGLIGPNGAGKTTLFELLSGFTKPDDGTIIFEGRQLSGTATVLGVQLRRSMSPERRGHLGLIRSFQDAGLFATLTVVDAVMLAMERTAPTTLFASVAGSQELERPKRTRARELIAMMGLDPHRDKPVSALSTGTRRIVELCCMIALEPKLLLLDEPSSGIAQRETEALGGVLREVKAHLGATLVVIEHDVPLIMDLSDRIIAMDTGQVIAQGTPQQVRMNEKVIESYLGGNVATIERSGVGAGVEA